MAKWFNAIDFDSIIHEFDPHHPCYFLRKFRKESDFAMNYVIKNHKNLYIRLNENGRPVTCSEKDRTLFECSKAKNILGSLPKKLKKLNFKVEAIPDIVPKEDKQTISESKVIQKENYVVSENVTHWIEKFGICDDILKEAQKRKEELLINLSNIDKEFSNMIHKIEFESKIDLYGGWIERNDIKINREKRRNIKDELLIISNVLRMDFRSLSSESIEKAVIGLANRKFTLRVTEEDEEDVV